MSELLKSMVISGLLVVLVVAGLHYLISSGVLL